ncbi:MAG: hypothetical protein ACP5VR_12365 [Acidimicrobiales bacterium]
MSGSWGDLTATVKRDRTDAYATVPVYLPARSGPGAKQGAA